MKTSKHIRDALLGFLVLLPAAIVLWLIIAYVVRVPSYLFPTPGETIASFQTSSSQIIKGAAVTLIEAISGLAVATTFGIASGIVASRSRALSVLSMPLFLASQAIPIVAIAPLFLLWFGSGLAAKILMAAVLCYFPIYISTIRGLGVFAGNAAEVLTAQGATPKELFQLLTLPGSVRSIMSGVRTSAAMAMLGAIVAEYTGASSGLGYLIMQASYRTDTALLFATLVASVACSFLAFSSVVFVEQTFLARFTRD